MPLAKLNPRINIAKKLLSDDSEGKSYKILNIPFVFL